MSDTITTAVAGDTVTATAPEAQPDGYGRFKVYTLQDTDGEVTHIAAVNALQALREYYRLTTGDDELAPCIAVDEPDGMIYIDCLVSSAVLEADNAPGRGKRSQSCRLWALEMEQAAGEANAWMISSTFIR